MMASQKEARQGGCKHRIPADKTWAVKSPPLTQLPRLFTGHRFRHQSRVCLMEPLILRHGGLSSRGHWLGRAEEEAIGWTIGRGRDYWLDDRQRKKDAKYSVLPHKVAVPNTPFQGSGITQNCRTQPRPCPGDGGRGSGVGCERRPKRCPVPIRRG